MARKTDERFVELRLSRRQAVSILAAGLGAIALGASSETLKLTSYVPSPLGVYEKLMSTKDAFFAKDGGKVGIGTAVPGGTLTIQGESAGAGYGRLDFFADAAAGDMLYDGGPDSIFRFRNTGGPTGRTSFVAGNGAEALVVANTGNVGLGTADPQDRLDVAGKVIVDDLKLRQLGMWLSKMRSKEYFVPKSDITAHHPLCSTDHAFGSPGCMAACNLHCKGSGHRPPGNIPYSGGVLTDAANGSGFVVCLCVW